MNKEIKYNGYSTQPSDYECQDGDLAISLNLILEHGTLKPIQSPVEMATIAKPYRILLIHKTDSGEIYLFSKSIGTGTETAVQLSFATGKEVSSSDWSGTPHDIGQIEASVICAAAIGNIIAISTSRGMRYLRWNSDKYLILPGLPPFVPVAFKASIDLRNAPRKSSTATIHGVYQDNGAIGSRPISAEQKEENQRFIEDSLIGIFNQLHAEAMEKGVFDQSFFIRYALRLFDGSYICHSSPIFFPVNKTVTAQVRREANKDDSSKTDVHFTMTLPTARLLMQIMPGQWADAMDLWEDVVESLEIFVSAPLYSIHTDKIDNVSVSGNSIALTPKRDWENNVCGCATFYKVISIRFPDIKAYADYRTMFINDAEGLNALVAKPTLPDEFRSMATVIPKTIFSFNNRLHIANYLTTPNAALPMIAMAGRLEFIETETANPVDADVFVSIISYINGRHHRSILPDSIISDNSLRTYGSLVFEKDGRYFLSLPKFLYVNEPTARWLELVITYHKSGETTKSQFIVRLPLTPHEFLNGAYWHDLSKISNSDIVGNLPDELMPSDAASLPFAPGSIETTTFNEYNKIKQSPVNNPFYFPPEGVTTTGEGRVIAISSAAQALSQGQFGQFPLYAFTTEGVWALEINSSGDFAARQPITRDIILATTMPLQMDRAVLFPTDRGIMLITGSQTQCITDVINAHEPFNVLQLPGMDKLHSMLGHDADTCLPAAPFLDFISECGMLYDYVHQRVIVYNPSYTYAYVYSLKSKEWGMMYSTIESCINSYPEALAVDHNGALLNFSAMQGVETKGLFVTRPLKLETPDILKTMDTVIQRGHFQKGHVQVALYGSRDLFNWHLVWSSKDHYLRGFRGTPDKYFRIAGVAKLNPDESVFGASIQFTPRFTNQPR